MTRGLCHITPIESGTCPSILLLAIFTSPPYAPVISVGGTRVEPVMVSSRCLVHGFRASTWRHRPALACDMCRRPRGEDPEDAEPRGIMVA